MNKVTQEEIDGKFRIMKSQCGKFDIYVDEEDFDWLTDYAKVSSFTKNGKPKNGIKGGWCVSKQKNKRNYYATKGRRFNGKIKSIKMHRLIMNVSDENIFVDHKDGNSLNNRRSNLRLVNRAQNSQNRIKTKVKTSKYNGVSKTYDGRFVAKVSVKGKEMHIGRFKCEKDAAMAYNEMALIHYGEYARTNIID